MDKDFFNNIPMTQTERITMASRPKQPKYDRNKNILVIGGSGSGKTRFFCKPSLLQAHSSYVCTDPKGTLLPEIGSFLERKRYRIKCLNLINFKKSMRYNPLAYIRSEKDILKLVNALIMNTKGEGEKSSEDFWVKAERLYYSALIGYIWYEAPEEERNFITLLDLINASEAREDDEEYQSPVDILFQQLAEKEPDHFAVKQYRKFKMAAGVVCSKRLLNQAVEKSLRTHNLKSKKGAQAMRKNEKITALYERLSRDDFGKDDDQQRESNSVVYNYVDENGETKQKWETWRTHKEALKRKAEIENQQHTGTFLPPSNQKISEFLYDFVSLYGEKKWGVSMYDSQTALIANYINPIIGDMEVQAVTSRVVDGYIQTLQKTRSVSTKTRKATTTYVSNQTIEKIIKLLRCAFKQAVRWEIIARNPFDNVILPKTEYKKRDIWDADMIRTALDKCTDSKLYVAMNLSFVCSLRMGEILGLTWDNVHISDEDIAADNAYVYVDKELTRASKRAIETLGEKDIYYIFTPLMPNTSTRIILKKPKTESSIRKVWLPKTLAYIMREWKKSQDELRSFLGDEYQDFNLVVALPNGRPCEDRIILKEFSKLREEAGLPRVVFHSLRHSSTTYKLKLNHGDLKATQGDTGHAEIDMITSIYAHILDEDRKVNAQKFETAFYANPDLRGVRPPEEPKQPEPATLDLASLVEQLQKSPELASALAALIAAQAPAK